MLVQSGLLSPAGCPPSPCVPQSTDGRGQARRRRPLSALSRRRTKYREIRAMPHTLGGGANIARLEKRTPKINLGRHKFKNPPTGAGLELQKSAIYIKRPKNKKNNRVILSQKAIFVGEL